MAQAVLLSDGQWYIFVRWITRNGKRIYHPKGGVFKIPVDKLKEKS